MSLPPGFLDALRDRVSLAQIVGRKVSWDMRKSNQGRGDWWAPCPFHQEKTASFHVEDRKGFYYCFGCHAKGDAIGFVMQQENLDFMEAVRRLADEAGLEMPQRDPQARARTDRREQLVAVMEEAQRYYALQLKSGAGRAARDYLSGRGLSDEALGRWGIGYAPGGWQSLSDHLRAKGIDGDLALGAGLVRASERGRAPYDVFRDRVIFPIRDARGRTVAFGGRAMDPGDKAKYLNSPETEIFDKGRILYNLGPARTAAGKGDVLVVVEGYMDVIALAEAGIGAAVAPLGTALTEAQLDLLWRLSPEPVMSLDGDAAGRRAALRLADLALPKLGPGRTLRFCHMPDGLDPDDLVRSKGAGAVRELLSTATGLGEMIWSRETDGKRFDSPERQAGLERALAEIAARISDTGVRRHYERMFRDRCWQLFRAKRATGRPRAPVATAGARASVLAADARSADALRETVVLALLMRHPQLIDEAAQTLERVEFSGRVQSRIARRLLCEAFPDSAACRDAIERDIGRDALETLLSAPHLAIVPALRGDDAEAAALCLLEELGKLADRRGAEREIDEAVQEIAHADEALTWRLGQAARSLGNVERAQARDVGEFDTAENGVRVSREERSAFDSLLQRIADGRRTRDG